MYMSKPLDLNNQNGLYLLGKYRVMLETNSKSNIMKTGINYLRDRRYVLKNINNFVFGAISLFFILHSLNASAQLSTNEPPISFTRRAATTSSIEVRQVTGLPSMEQIRKEDIQDSISGYAPRFGYPLEVNLNTDNSGTWKNYLTVETFGA